MYRSLATLHLYGEGVSSTVPSGSARQRLIADAGVRIIATRGVRALTHRAVDRAAGIAEGGTSYYARTRHALLGLIVDELAARSIAEAEHGLRRLREQTRDGSPVGIEAVERAVSELIETLWARSEDMRARYALLLELDPRDPLRERLAERSDVHRALFDETRSVLHRAGVDNSTARAGELLALADALLMRRAVTLTEAPAAPIIGGYLRGIAQERHSREEQPVAGTAEPHA